MMTVAELIEELKKVDPSLPVCYRCYSEHCGLEKDDLKVQDLQPAREDGWVHDDRPDKSTIKYLVLPGN